MIEELDLFFQFARGFRSPPFEDVNIGLDIPQFGIRAIPNPDLEPERGHTLETGIRYRTGSTMLDLAVFRNRFKDFIDTRALVGFDPATGVLLFQSINRDRVEIEGAELRARQQLGYGFDLELAAEWTRGEDRATDRSLAGISPPQAIAALSYAPTPDWEIRFITTATRSQRRLVDEQGDPLFSAPGSTVFDLTGRWQVTPGISLSAGLFNLTDKRWFNHAPGQLLQRVGRPHQIEMQAVDRQIGQRRQVVPRAFKIAREHQMRTATRNAGVRFLQSCLRGRIQVQPGNAAMRYFDLTVPVLCGLMRF